MKRFLICATLACALLLPSLALGGTFTYLGPLQGGANNAGIEFGIKFRNGHPRKVRRLEFHNVNAAPCYYNSGFLTPGWKINRKAKFHGTVTFNNGNAFATITGTLKRRSNHYKKIVGTFRAHGPASCDTGVIPYVAKKGG